MSHTILRKERGVCVKLLGSRLEPIQKLKPPTIIKSFISMVNFLSLFCPELQNY